MTWHIDIGRMENCYQLTGWNAEINVLQDSNEKVAK